MSAVYGAINQGRAAEELADVEQTFAADADLTQVAEAPNVKRKAEVLARQFASQATAETGVGRIKIPSIGVDYVFLNGTDTSPLQRGPGRYPETAFPGQDRTVGIAGHQTTHLAPFRKIDDLDEGDEIIVEMPYATFTYAVEKSEIVKPTDAQIVDDTGRERLVLTACHPLFSAAEYYALFCRAGRYRAPQGAPLDGRHS